MIELDTQLLLSREGAIEADVGGATTRMSLQLSPYSDYSQEQNVKRHNCFRKQRHVHRESTLSMDTILFPITVMHFYSYPRHILEYTRGMFLACARADVKAVSDFFACSVVFVVMVTSQSLRFLTNHPNQPV
jgi:hypothetical protein